MATQKKPGAKAPIVTCPFTGANLEIVHNTRLGQWCARGSFWTTRWFPFKDDLIVALSTRDGVAPAFAPARLATAAVQAPPQNPVADQVAKGRELLNLANGMPLTQTVADLVGAEGT